MKKKGRVLHGWRYESLEEKIRHMLSLPLAERYEQCLAKGKLAEFLEKNQSRLYGKSRFKSIQILRLPKERKK